MPFNSLLVVSGFNFYIHCMHISAEKSPILLNCLHLYILAYTDWTVARAPFEQLKVTVFVCVCVLREMCRSGYSIYPVVLRYNMHVRIT